MAEFGDSLLHFDSILLDANENPPNAENYLFADNNEIHNNVLSKAEITPQCDLTFSGETFQSSNNPSNCNEISESTNELDELSQHLGEQNTQCNLTFSDTLQTSVATNNSTEILGITNELDMQSFDVIAEISSNRNSDSGIHDSENNIVEDTNVIDFTDVGLNLPDNGRMISEFKNEENGVHLKDEEFHDAVQFFKDPAFTMLENAGSANSPTDTLMTRSSLYVNFDPLHAKFYSQSVKSSELQEIAEDDVHEVPFDNVQSDIVPDIVNKHLNNVSLRESTGNILISFDSPVTNKDTFLQSVDSSKHSEPPKIYTEEELQQALKIQELRVQETFLKRQQDLEMTRTQKQIELETKIQEQNKLSNAYHCILKEFVDVVIVLSEKKELLQKKFETIEKENDKLKEDLRTSGEDLQSVENTFSDFHKRYEQCKSMLKVYTQNEDNLKQQVENMKVQLEEKEEMYKVLQSRTQEMLDKANTEVASVKKAGDAQVAVLKAQLKKGELKISSLESDVKQVKIENDKLSSICDDLMAKVSEA